MTAARPARHRERLLRAVRKQVREVTAEVLSSALVQLEGADTPGGRRGRALGRTRDVLERDRALRAASVSAPMAAPWPGPAPACEGAGQEAAPEAVHAAGVDPSAPPPAPTPAPAPALAPASAPAPAVVCDEPIRTRTMAKLLATQGHPARAISIYRYLLATGGPDAALDAEIASLVAAMAAEPGPIDAPD